MKCVYTSNIIYRVILEERPIFWETIVSVIVSRKVHLNTCLIRNSYRDKVLQIFGPNPVTASFEGLDEERS